MFRRRVIWVESVETSKVIFFFYCIHLICYGTCFAWKVGDRKHGLWCLDRVVSTKIWENQLYISWEHDTWHAWHWWRDINQHRHDSSSSWQGAAAPSNQRRKHSSDFTVIIQVTYRQSSDCGLDRVSGVKVKWSLHNQFVFQVVAQHPGLTSALPRSARMLRFSVAAAAALAASRQRPCSPPARTCNVHHGFSYKERLNAFKYCFVNIMQNLRK